MSVCKWRPKLEYACSVWNPHTAEHCNKIEMVQRRAARYACNRYHNTSSVTDMLQTLTWPSLQQRRLKTKLIMFYKIVHHIVAVPTTILIPTDPRIRKFHPLHTLVLDGQEIGMSATLYLCWRF
jgi:hypothetical protein